MGPGCSHFWQSLLSVNDIFQQFSEKIMVNGEKNLFWEDKWVNNAPLAVQFPRLYQLSFQKGFTVKVLKQQGWSMIQFTRTLLGDTLQQWHALKNMVDEIQLSEGKNRVKWKIGSSGQFRVKDLYHQMRAEGSFPQKIM
jgi:hypothetical protein